MKIIADIRAANDTREATNIGRRLIKLNEEIGEHAEAYLNASSTNNNGKNKTWDDVREEAADCVIVAVDVALTPLFEFNRSETERNLNEFLARFDTLTPRDYSNYERLTLQNSALTGKVSSQFLDADLYQRSPVYNMVKAAIDLALTPLPDRLDWTPEQMLADLEATITTKLAKWTSNRKTGKAPTDAE